MIGQSSLSLLNLQNSDRTLKLIHNSKANISNGVEPFYVTDIKKQIINKFLIPISNNDLDIILEYDYMISFLKDRLIKIMLIYKSSYQLDIYKKILDSINYAVVYHRIILMKTNKQLKNTDFSKLQRSLGIINIKAEYIIYDEIFGPPNKINGENYNPDTINEIRKLLNRFDINFDKIKEIVKNKYK